MNTFTKEHLPGGELLEEKTLPVEITRAIQNRKNSGHVFFSTRAGVAASRISDKIVQSKHIHSADVGKTGKPSAPSEKMISYFASNIKEAEGRKITKTYGIDLNQEYDGTDANQAAIGRFGRFRHQVISREFCH